MNVENWLCSAKKLRIREIENVIENEIYSQSQTLLKILSQFYCPPLNFDEMGFMLQSIIMI